MALHAGTLGGATSVAAAAFPLTPTAGTAFVSVNGLTLVDAAAATLSQQNGATAQAFRVYGTTTGPKYTELSHNATDAGLDSVGGGGINFKLAGATYMQLSSSAHLLPGTNNSQDVGATTTYWRTGYFGNSVVIAGPTIIAGSGTGLTVAETGCVRRLTYKATTTYLAFAAAATTGDKAICILPPKTRVTACYADTTTKYIGGNISATTLRLGISAGGVEVIASHDVFAAAVTKGLADADMGTSMTRAAQIQGGYTPSFTANTTLTARITTTSNNTNVLTQGSTTWYIETELLP